MSSSAENASTAAVMPSSSSRSDLNLRDSLALKTHSVGRPDR